MTYARAVTAQLLHATTLAVIGGSPLANSFGHTFMDELSGPGSGSVSMPLSDAGAAELTPGRYVQILVAGTARFTFKIEGDPEYKQIMQGGQLEQVVIVSGRGWGCMLDEAIVYPDADPNLRLDTSWRIFSFASPDFPAANLTSWANAVELYEYLDGVTYGERYQFTGVENDDPMPAPIGFPWPTQGPGQLVYDPGPPETWSPGVGYDPTYWIATQQGDSTEEFAIGYQFFRKTLTIAGPLVIEFAVTADNAFTLFVEGIPVVGENDDIWIWTGWKDATINFSSASYPADFQIAVVVENISHGLPGEGVNQNSTGLILNAFTRGAGQLPDEVYLTSDNTWLSEFNATMWPGWTAGQIVAKLITEAQDPARDALFVFVGDTFTDTLDTAGDAWASSDPALPSGYIPAFAVNVGTTIMAALGELHEQGWVDWHMQPGTPTLDMWSASKDDGDSGVVFAAGTNITSLERSSSGPYANALLVQWDQGYVTVADVTEITAYGGRVEDIWSTDAASETEAESKGNVELQRRITENWPAVALGLEPVDEDDCPYEGFDLGESVTIPAVGGGTELVRVLSITLTTDPEGWAIWALELNRRWNVPQATANDLLRAVGGRGGSSSGGVVY